MIPKFRVWDKWKKVMLYQGDENAFTDGGEVLVLSLTGELWAASYPDVCGSALLTKKIFWKTEKDRYVVNISTGFKSKDDKEIFEDDIVIGEWCYLHPTIVELPAFFYWVRECALDGELTILGNIHQNPELLREKKHLENSP